MQSTRSLIKPYNHVQSPKATRRHRKAHVSMWFNPRLCLIIRPPNERPTIIILPTEIVPPLLYRMEHIGALIILRYKIETTYVMVVSFLHKTLLYMNVMMRS